MEISYDADKRAKTLAERALDFDDAAQVLAGKTIEFSTTAGTMARSDGWPPGCLKGRMVALVWTPRGEGRHIISMRKANEREKKSLSARPGSIRITHRS